MTHALPLLPDIALPSGVARQIAPLWRTAALALAGLLAFNLVRLGVARKAGK